MSGIRFRIDENVEKFITEIDKIVIQAEGGTGKSTLAKYITYQANQSSKLFCLYIQLSDVYKQANLNEYFDNLGINELELQIISTNYRILFILDGLDETPNISQSVSDIRYFSNKLRSSKFILTSRPNQFTKSLGFKEYKIIDFSLEESFNFIKKIDSSLLGEKLVNSIQANKESVNDLLNTPLSLILLYRVFKKTGSLSKSIYDLYKNLFEVLYEEHDVTSKGRIREKQTDIDSESFYKVILYIAFKSADSLDISFSKTDLKSWVNEAKKKLELNFSSDEFISDLILHIPLIIQNGFNEYKWIHKSIRNYYAACYIVSDKNREELLKEKYNFSKINNWTEILEMCYDLDYNLFEKVILYPISRDYITFHQNSYKNINRDIISEEEINRRKSLIFGRDVILFPNKWWYLMHNEDGFFKHRINIQDSIKKKYGIEGYAIATPEVGFSQDKLESWKLYYPPSFIKIILRKKGNPLVSTSSSSEYAKLLNNISNQHLNFSFSDIGLKNEECMHVDELLLIRSFFKINGYDVPFFVLVTDSLIGGTIGGGCGYVIEECIKLVQKYEKSN